MDKDMTLGLSEERVGLFDFIIISTTHLHMHSPEPDNSDPEYRAKLWVQRLDALFNMNLPFKKIGVAHLTCFLINRASVEHYRKALALIPACELDRLFKKAADLGVGIEINKDDATYLDRCGEEILRIYRAAKKWGCKFYFGSDSHHPEEFEGYVEACERMIDLLGLTEEDRFVI